MQPSHVPQAQRSAAGLVGTSAVTITAVVDFRSSSTGKVVYWRVD